MVLIRRPFVVFLTVGLVVLVSACTGGDPVPDPSSSASAAPTTRPSDSQTPQGLPSTDTPPLSEAPSAAGPDPSTDEGSTEDGRKHLVAALDAGSVGGGAGDGAATGDFEGTLTPLEATVELCYELEVEGLSSPPASAQILLDDPAGSDPVVVDLEAPDDTGRAEACVIIDGGSAVGLFQEPSQHYVLVTTQGHPDGAVRGQLREG